MRMTRTVLLPLVMASLVGSTARADVQFSMQEGRVVIVAKDATVAEILAEWARIGGTKIVNINRLPSERVTLQLQNVSERQALDVLLRNTSGYIAGPRAVADPNASLFDRIAIMPPSAAPPPAARASATPMHPQQASRPAPEPASMISQHQPGIAPAESAEESPSEGRNEEPPPQVVVIGAGVPSAQAAQPQPTISPLQKLEVVNPRDFPLPVALRNGGIRQPSGALAPGMGASVPGMIVPPPNASPVPGQPFNTGQR